MRRIASDQEHPKMGTNGTTGIECRNSSLLDLQHLISLLRKQHFARFGALLPRVGRCKDISELLESALARLNREEVDERGLNHIPRRQDNVRVPIYNLHGVADTKLVDQQSDVGEDGVDGHALGAGLIRQTLDGVHGLQWCPAKTVEEADEENDHD